MKQGPAPQKSSKNDEFGPKKCPSGPPARPPRGNFREISPRGPPRGGPPGGPGPPPGGPGGPPRGPRGGPAGALFLGSDFGHFSGFLPRPPLQGPKSTHFSDFCLKMGEITPPEGQIRDFWPLVLQTGVFFGFCRNLEFYHLFPIFAPPDPPGGPGGAPGPPPGGGFPGGPFNKCIFRSAGGVHSGFFRKFSHFSLVLRPGVLKPLRELVRG